MESSCYKTDGLRAVGDEEIQISTHLHESTDELEPLSIGSTLNIDHDKAIGQSRSVNLICCNIGHSSLDHGLEFMHLQEGIAS